MVLDVVSDGGIFSLEMDNHPILDKHHLLNEELSNEQDDSNPLVLSDMPDLVQIEAKPHSEIESDENAEKMEDIKSSQASSVNASDLLEDLMTTITTSEDCSEVNLALNYCILNT